MHPRVSGCLTGCGVTTKGEERADDAAANCGRRVRCLCVCERAAWCWQSGVFTVYTNTPLDYTTNRSHARAANTST